ncbi:DedA family protein [Corynebacterium bovis]|uniref:VTT domain-containing protein n=3 Tax=Corynebacterium bovis TaxID=36808 RepID=A0A3R8QQH9_9CORY|nr:DedA family protein [Corynebacterium bovis]MDH2456345.1 DedA family protein [Corynebacterium bovis]MDK8511776.1 DedA family protein [Corynebacterium bovis]RRO90876.1 hypothetical protein CXF40_07900 [Corynebacterium bovis]RRO97591.1 hypothetical protein CXF32_03615 [Corynebacterium bovis]RRO98815.1 hypothetical protein CXF31_03780 [Corynebacterium bovis]
MLSSLVDSVVSLVDTFGGPGVGLAILAETVLPFIPSEVILPLAGFTSTQGQMSAWSAFIWATVASTVMGYILYWVGAAIGAVRLRRWADRMWLTEAADVDRALRWFDRFGSASVLICRMLPGLRVLISVPAGVHRMPLVRFGVLTTVGSIVWNAALIWLGIALGENWHRVSDTIEKYSVWFYLACAVAVVAVLVVLVRRAVRRRARPAAGTVPGDDAASPRDDA